MKIGIVGLGRMGAGIAARLRRDAHEVVGYDRDPATSEVGSLGALVDTIRIQPHEGIALCFLAKEPGPTCGCGR